MAASKYNDILSRLTYASNNVVSINEKDELIKDSLMTITELIGINSELKNIIDSYNPSRRELMNLEDTINKIYDVLRNGDNK